jgi:cell division protein FtsL
MFYVSSEQRFTLRKLSSSDKILDVARDNGINQEVR